jgi:hypothetical protein
MEVGKTVLSEPKMGGQDHFYNFGARIKSLK